jgi:thiamine-phosphate pyrophosphorylase
MRPVICLVTPPLVRLERDTAYVAADPTSVLSGLSRTTDDLVERIGAAARAGVHLVQIRQPGMDGGPLAALTTAAIEAVRGTRTRVLVNERFDVALAVGAHGVHLRSDSFPAPRVRASAPREFLIGRSVHTLEEARAAAGDGATDYVIFGTVFATDSKSGAPTAGPERLAAVCAAVQIPVLAIGGITLARLDAVAAAGADGLAAIGLFSGGAADGMRQIVGQVVRTFDTPRRVP